MGDVLKLEAVAVKYGAGPWGTINEESVFFHIVFSFEFTDEDDCAPDLYVETPDMKISVRLRIDSGAQPVLLVINANHAFVKCDLIRSPASRGP